MVDTPILADRHMNPVTRAQPRARRENRAVQYSIVIPVFHEQDNIRELYRRTFDYREGMFPVAEEIGQRTISMPLYPKLANEEVDYVIAVVKEAVGKDRAASRDRPAYGWRVEAA